jgi:hypothetical protein
MSTWDDEARQRQAALLAARNHRRAAAIEELKAADHARQEAAQRAWGELEALRVEGEVRAAQVKAWQAEEAKRRAKEAGDRLGEKVDAWREQRECRERAAHRALRAEQLRIAKEKMAAAAEAQDCRCEICRGNLRP